MKEKNLLSAIQDRRTYYAIGSDAVLSDAETAKRIEQAVLHVPSAFNSQSGRVVVLFGEAHKKLWNITLETLHAIVAADRFAPTEEKIASFAAGHGSVLYFNDEDVTAGLMEQFAAYRDNFPIWAQQANGMLQYAVWMLLEEQGFGVSLQHYNPLIDEQVKRTWGLPASWKLIAEMPFGTPLAAPGEKAFAPLESRMKVFER